MNVRGLVSRAKSASFDRDCQTVVDLGGNADSGGV